MQRERIHKINNFPTNKKGEYVFYWVQTGLRIEFNYSLYFAIQQANKLNKPLLVFFALKEFPWGNLRQYQFLKEGIIEFKKNLENLGVNFLIKKVNDFDEIIKETKSACLVVADFGYLKNQRYWRELISQKINIPFFEIESDVLVPIKVISLKKINFAFQIRRKIFNTLPYFSSKLSLPEIKNKTKIINQDIKTINFLFDNLKIDFGVKPTRFIGGEQQANKILKIFINNKLSYYKNYHRDPSKDIQSNLSAYLHFGFISPVKIVNEILKNYSLKDENVIAFFDELLVWRELCRNFVYFEKNYDNWKNLPSWAIKTLDFHQNDKKRYLYSLKDLENGKTYDVYWNAAQKEMVIGGKMHNYMRMYWAKKIIEWTKDWRQAYQWLIYLNDKYELDGRDPNGYGGIAWSFGQFDHPWKERKIFGKVRYMNDKGLERKFNMKLYLEKIENLERNSVISTKR